MYTRDGPLCTIVLHHFFRPLPSALSISSSKQPHVNKNRPHRCEEQHPRLPPDARPLRHPQHPIHRATQPHPGVVEPVIHRVGQRTRRPDLVPDGDGDVL